MYNHFSLNFTLWSKFRSELMGLSMIGIIIEHFIQRLDLNNSILDFIYHHFHLSVENFLLLSGFGLSYSLCKSPSLATFYRKRLLRVFIPYIIIMLPFFVLDFYYGNSSFLQVVLRTLSIDYWINGNFSGDWYISSSLLLYLFAPFIYAAFRKRKSEFGEITILCSLCLGVTLFAYLLNSFMPFYYELTNYTWRRIPAFIIGLFIGYIINQKNYYSRIVWVSVLFLFLIYKFALYYKILPLSYYKTIINIVALSVWACLINIIAEFQFAAFFMRVFKWIGVYSLEIYLLHISFWVLFLQDSIYEFLCQYMDRDIIALFSLILSFLMCVPLHSFIEIIKNKIQ